MVALGSPDILDVVCSPRTKLDPFQFALLAAAGSAVAEFISLKDQGCLPDAPQITTLRNLFKEEIQRQEVVIPHKKQEEVRVEFDELARIAVKGSITRVWYELEKVIISITAKAKRDELIRKGNTPIIFYPSSTIYVDHLALESTFQEYAEPLAHDISNEGQVLRVDIIYSSIGEFTRGLKGKRIKINYQLRTIRERKKRKL